MSSDTTEIRMHLVKPVCAAKQKITQICSFLVKCVNYVKLLTVMFWIGAISPWSWLYSFCVLTLGAEGATQSLKLFARCPRHRQTRLRLRMTKGGHQRKRMRGRSAVMTDRWIREEVKGCEKEQKICVQLVVCVSFSYLCQDCFKISFIVFLMRLSCLYWLNRHWLTPAITWCRRCHSSSFGSVFIWK